MTRTLPWLKSKVEEAEPSLPRLTTKRKLQDAALELEDHRPLNPVRIERSRVARTPSTSPPPLQPLHESPLRTGLDRDDIYIMVEDEFLSAAQAFTRHLHHAEYHRLKHEAKNRNASTITSISRPTDGKTDMRKELKLAKRSKDRYVRARGGVEQVFPADARPHRDSDISDDAFDLESDNEIWQGTHLDVFKGNGPNKGIKSLTGIQKPVSHTRAAAGYDKAENKSPRRDIIYTKPKSMVLKNDEDEGDDDLTDDDLDKPTFIKRESSPLKRTTITQKRPNPDSIDSTRSRPFAHYPESFTPHRPSNLAKVDDRPAEDSAKAIRERMKARREKEALQKIETHKNGSKSSTLIEEIPMF